MQDVDINRGEAVYMRAAIIGASRESIHAINKAKELGIYVIAIDGNSSAEGLQVADKSIVIDIADVDNTVNCLRKEEIDFCITAPIGRYITTTGAVNTRLGLIGVGYDATYRCSDKYLFHKVLSESYQYYSELSLRNCFCYLIDDEYKSDHDMIINNIEYPVIIKPRYGAGSRGIHYINNIDELYVTMSVIQEEEDDYVLEQVIQGVEYGIDAAVLDGQYRQLLIREKINTPPPARQAVGYYSVSYENDPELYMRIDDYLSKVVSVIGVDNCLMHADIIVNDMECFVIEMSPRPSGHYLYEVFTPCVTGIDVANEYCKYMMSAISAKSKDNNIIDRFNKDVREDMQYLIHYYDIGIGTVRRIPEFDILSSKLERYGVKLLHYICNIQLGDIIGDVTSGASIMGRGYYILAGSDRASLVESISIINREFVLF